MLGPLFAGRAKDTAEENVQSRVRGTTLMAISNKFGSMLLTTGNKSEMSVGYATIYGDMNGGFNPIKDLYKMEVYRLCRWRNANVPEGGKGPRRDRHPREHHHQGADGRAAREPEGSGQLCRPTKRSTTCCACLVEHEMPLADIVKRGHARETVEKINRLLNIAEYKRRQAAPGVKISERNFGRDRRYPITNRFRESFDAPAGPAPAAAPKMVKPRADGGEVS